MQTREVPPKGSRPTIGRSNTKGGNTMKVDEIIKLANEYDSLSKNAEYTQHFLSQVRSERTSLSVLSRGAEMDIHHQYKAKFLTSIDAYLVTLNERMDEIQALLEGNYAKGEA